MKRTIDGIQFNNIYSSSEGGTLIGDTLTAQTFGDIPIINGAEIDWNAAQLPNSGDTAGNQQIDSTGNLLSLINEMNKRLYALTAAVIALSNK